MKLSLKSTVLFAALSALAVTPVMLLATPASAQTTGMDGSYVGAGASIGVTENSDDFGGNIQGRFDIPTVPVSLRGAVLFSDNTSAIVPTVTYDIPVARNTNVYAGAGYSFVENEGRATTLGNQDSVVLTAGVEGTVARNVVLYSDVKLGIDAFQNSSNSAVSFQVGAGYRF